MCRKKDTNEILALKIMEKSLIWTRNKKRQVKNERDVLAQGAHDHLVRLHYSFQDPHYLYLAMEYCPGGDMYHLVENLNALEENDARLYIAEMIAAIHSLHGLGYIHRDLKPDNFLIDSKGHIKLADFGLSKEGLRQFAESPSMRGDRTCKSGRKGFHSVVGSPDYMAPEILSSTSGYGKEVDWWSLGCLIYEMVTGIPPFNATTAQEVFDNIINWKHTLPKALSLIKEYFSEEFMDLIEGFLCEPEKRLGCDIEVVKRHPFFKSINWDNLRSHPPLFVPVLENEFDVSYFDLPMSPAPQLQSLPQPQSQLLLKENKTPKQNGNHQNLKKTSLLRDKENLSNPLRMQLERLHRTRSLDWSEKMCSSPLKEVPLKAERGAVMYKSEKRARPLWLVTPTRDVEPPSSEKLILGFTFQRKQQTRVQYDRQQLPTFKLTENPEDPNNEQEEDLMNVS
uniref:non-specific serine/threonine protein kinase n=1 Tax=Arcella intermedia TaxID=1963864 RepID=A0A6B2L3F5_9EUKA